MKKAKTFAAFLAAATLTGTLALPANAALLPTDGEPLAEILYQMQETPNGMIEPIQIGTWGYKYFDENSFHQYQLTELSYEIKVESGTKLPEDIKEQLLAALPLSDVEQRTQFSGVGDYIGKRVVSDTKTDESGNLNPISLVQLDDTTYQFQVNPRWFLTDDEVLTRICQTIPGFVSIQKNAVGYDLANIDSDMLNGYSSDGGSGYFSNGWTVAPIYLYTDNNGEILTAEDFPEELHVKEVMFSKYTTTDSDGNESVYKPGGYYQVTLDETAFPEQISCTEMYQILSEFREMGIFTNVTREFSVEESVNDPTPYLIDNGAMTFATRGDCDRDEAITMQDAYQALIANSTEAAGGTAALSGREALAADVDGDGNISMNDAYRILIYSSTRSAGAEASWAEILQ